jgi:hypothetical protein
MHEGTFWLVELACNFAGLKKVLQALSKGTAVVVDALAVILYSMR